MPMTRDEWLAMPRSKRPYEDGEIEQQYTITRKHCYKASRKSLDFCVQADSLSDMQGALWGHVYLDRAYVQYENRDVPTRFQLSTRGRKVAKINDRYGTKGLLVELEAAGGEMTLGLMPPRFAISKRRLRSEGFKKLRKESRERNKHKSTRRPYTKPSAVGLRSGIGQA